MHKFILLLIIILLSTVLLRAQQTIHGRITNLNYEPLSNVTVEIKGTKIKTLSNQDGKYTIDVPKKRNTLVFSTEGYWGKEIEILYSVINVKLTKVKKDIIDYTLIELQNIKVKISTKSETKLSEAPAIVSVVTTEEIKNSGARDLRDVLRTIPGFQLGMREIGYTTIGIRGVITPNSEKVKIMIDGVSINENLEGSGTVVFADMVLDNIERIEIIRGPGSALYGTNAFMGVINIISKKAEDIDGVIATVKGGSYKTMQGNIIVGKEYGDFAVSGSFDYLATDGPIKKIEFDALSNDTLCISLAGTDKGVTHSFRKKITSSLNADYKGFYFKSLYIGTKKGDYVGATSVITENSEAKHFQMQEVLGYEYQFSEKLNIDINAVYFMYSVDNLLNLYPTGYQGIFTQGLYQEMGGKQQNINTNMLVNYKLLEKNKFQIGASYAYIKHFDEIFKTNSPETGIDNLEDIPSYFDDVLWRTISSAYIQYKRELFKSLSFTAGVRYDNYSDAGYTVNPRAAIVFTPDDKLILKLLYGTAFRAPTFVESYLNGAPFILGDKTNESETIKTYEAYLSYSFSENISASVNYFYNDIENLITIVADPELAIGRYSNSGETINVQGIESELRILIPEIRSYAYFTYTYQKGEKSETNDALIGMANQTAYAGINYKGTKGFNINLMANYIGVRQRSIVDTRTELNGFTLLNLSIFKKDIINNFDVQISGFNLLDSDHRVPDINGIIYNDYPLEGINFLAEITYKF